MVLFHSFLWLSNIPLYTYTAATAAAKSLQSCPTLCDPIDGSQPGSPIPGILQARTLERVAISFSNACKWKVKVKSLSHVRLLATRGLQSTMLLCPLYFPGKSTGMGCYCLLHLQSLPLFKDKHVLLFFQIEVSCEFIWLANQGCPSKSWQRQIFLVIFFASSWVDGT